jgi:hypothetical protein
MRIFEFPFFYSTSIGKNELNLNYVHRFLYFFTEVRGTNKSGHLDFRKIMSRKYTRASLFRDIEQILLRLKSSDTSRFYF